MKALKTDDSQANSSLLLKITSLRKRAGLLMNLQKSVGLQPQQDISAEQWLSLESQLASVANKIKNQLRIYTDKYFSERNDTAVKQTLINRLGELEVELTNAYSFYDTFMDILTQRLSTDIGEQLKGCDTLAAFALKRGSLAEVTVAPLVYCDRGFGASILREGVRLNGNANPIPFIAIPYSRMSEKYNLISIFHEVGHQAMAKLNMVSIWKQVFQETLSKAGASPMICELYANWSKELVPDFWAFCLSGMAQTCSIRDVLVLPTDMMFHVSTIQPHPPSYIRFLVSCQWCRYLWGQGDWDTWEAEWKQLYPLASIDKASKQIISEATQYIPVAAKAYFTTKFRKLSNQPLTSLFELNILEPNTLKKLTTKEGITTNEFNKKPIGVQLAIFRLMREKSNIKQAEIDKIMNNWLKTLANK